MHLRKHSLVMIILVLLLVSNSVSAVWIYPDTDIYAGGFTLNTKSAQNFTYIEIGTTYTNLSWDGVTYHNITYVTNVTSNLSFIQMDIDTGLLGFDVYYPTAGWTVTSPSIKILNANDTVESTLTSFTITTINSTHKHYSTTYAPTGIATADMGYFDVNISLTAQNSTLIFSGYKRSDNLFMVYDLIPTNHPPTNITSSRSIIELNGICSLGNYTTNIGCDIYAPGDWIISSASMVPTTNNSYADTTVSTYSSSTINATPTHQHLIFLYNPSNSLDTIDMGKFSVNISVYAYNSTHMYSNYTTSADLFEVYELDPAYNSTSGFNSTYISVNTSWDSGNNSDLDVVIRNNNTYPSCPSDGYEVQNSTSNYYNTSISTNDTVYLTVFSYNSTTHSYSSGRDMPWGAMQFQCFNESNAAQAINFDIEITNSDASQVYTASDISNGQSISFDDIPYGDNTIILISNSSYKQRTYYKDLAVNHFYNYSFYLPPLETEGGGGTGEGTLRIYTDIKSVTDPSSDLTITLTHTMDEMIGVYVYNVSGTYPEWVSVPNENYTISGSDIIINQSVLGVNTTMAKVTYWYIEYDDTVDTQLYFIRVVDEADNSVADANIIVKRYINTTDSYEEIGGIITGGYGYASIYLVPNTFYKVFVTKDGYDDNIENWITDPDNYGISNPLIIQLNLEEPEFINETSFDEAIAFSACLYANGSIQVNYSDSLEETTSTTIHIYEGITLDSFHWDNRTGEDSFTFWVTGANTSRSYQVVLTLHHETFGENTIVDTICLILREPFTNKTFFDTLFDVNYGSNPFGWSSFLGFFIMLAGVFSFGQRNTGVAMLLTGGILLFINNIIGLNIIGSVIPILFIVLGILVQWGKHRKEMVG